MRTMVNVRCHHCGGDMFREDDAFCVVIQCWQCARVIYERTRGERFTEKLMSSNYPPGVTGDEPQIAGYPECDDEDCNGISVCSGGTCTRLCDRCLAEEDADRRIDERRDRDH